MHHTEKAYKGDPIQKAPVVDHKDTKMSSSAETKEKLVLSMDALNEAPGWMRALAKRGSGEVGNMYCAT